MFASDTRIVWIVANLTAILKICWHTCVQKSYLDSISKFFIAIRHFEDFGGKGFKFFVKKGFFSQEP